MKQDNMNTGISHIGAQIHAYSPQVLAALFFTSIGFLLIGLISYLMAPSRLTEAQIEARAERDTPPAQCAPQPAGRTEQYTVDKQICVNLPVFEGLKISARQSCTKVQEPATRFVGPPTDEIRKWEAECKLARDLHSHLLQSKADDLALHQRAVFKEYVNDMIKIALGIAGVKKWVQQHGGGVAKRRDRAIQ